MHIEYGGGTGGIRKYLEDAKKHGRELGGRDVMDERIVLEGNLEITDRIIESMATAGQRYLHITPSFVEKDLSAQMLGAIVADYRTHLMAAFRPEEYDFYAEAHVARMKGYTDATTGEQIVRLDHIHIVIPQVNLITGRGLNPIGLAERNVKWLDAIQEHINEKYGLVSPKDRPRDDTSAADILQRRRLDNFKRGKIHAFKEDLKEKIFFRNISTPADLKDLADELGDAKWVNVGKPNAYLAVKPHGQARYINLRDADFGTEMLSLSKDEKHARTAVGASTKVGVGKTTSDQRAALLSEWTEKRALEIKYLNSGDKLYKKYHQQTPKEQRQTLAAVEERFYQKPSFKETYHGINQGSATEDPGNRRPPVHRQSNVEKIRSEPTSKSLHSVRSVHQRSMDRDGRPNNSEELLQGPVSNVLDRRGSGAHHALRRDAAALRGPGPCVNPATGRESDSVVNQMLRDKREQIAQKAVAQQSDFQSLKRRLDPARLLAALSKTHGVIPSDYEISTGRDGGGRIRHKESTQNFNVSDFMTKHMKLTWNDAESYLRSTYQAQLDILPPTQTGARPRRDLWAEFTAERQTNDAAQAQERAHMRELQCRSERARRRAIKETFYHDKARAKRHLRMTAGERRAEIALLQMAKVQKEADLRENIQRERARTKELRTYREQYRDWLRERAQKGDEKALAELRRQRIEPATKAWLTDPMIGPVEERPDTGHLHRMEGLQYTVHENGDVTYSRDGKALIRDQGKSVRMLDTAANTIELGLRLAMQKYGNKLTLTGPTDFVEKAIRTAVDGKMDITFSDSRHREYMQLCKQQRAKQKALEATLPSIQPTSTPTSTRKARPMR